MTGIAPFLTYSSARPNPETDFMPNCMKKQLAAVRPENWAHIAIDSRISRRVGHPVKKSSKPVKDWANKAVDAWIQRRLGKSSKSSKTKS